MHFFEVTKCDLNKGPTNPAMLAQHFEISDADLKPGDGNEMTMETDNETASSDGADEVFELRGHPVMLAAAVAEIFQVQTREIVQNIKENNKLEPPMFPERYAFEITEAEREVLRSAGLISKPGQGGSRALPWVVTRKGAIRLATIMKSPRAMQAADIFVDVFDEVLVQIRAGQAQITLPDPSRLLPATADEAATSQFRTRISAAVNKLLDTVVDSERHTTVADEMRETAAEAINHIKEWLRGKKITNEKIEAETLLIIEQARDMYERRQADLADKKLDRDRKALENVKLRIGVVQELLQLQSKLEPNAVVDMVGAFAKPVLPLPKPAKAKKRVRDGD